MCLLFLCRFYDDKNVIKIVKAHFNLLVRIWSLND